MNCCFNFVKLLKGFVTSSDCITRMRTTGLCVVLTHLLLASVSMGYVRLCYYTNWSQYRPAPSRFTPDDVDPFLCTHIIFAFADVKGTEVVPTEPNDEFMYSKLVSVKEKNPELKVLLSLGGWLVGGRQFSALVSSDENIVAFVNNLIDYLRRFGFDGVDVDWEYPGDRQRGSVPADRLRFTRLLRRLHEGFEEEAQQTGGPRLLLTAAVYGEIEPSRTYYQIPHIARWVDYANLMAYDFHGQWDLASGARHHAALFPEVHDSVQGWLQEGFPAEKLVLGTAAFARTFSLATRPRGTGVGQRAVSIGLPGNFSDTEGLLTYQEICHLLKSGQWQRMWLEEQQAPVAFGNVTGGRWVWAGYDDQESLMAKTNYIRQNELAGVMLWSMTNDDFNNHCGDGAWPLMSVLQQQLPDNRSPSPELPTSLTSAASVSTATTLTTTTVTAVTIAYDTTRWTASDRARSDRTLPAERTHQTSEVVRPTTATAAAVAPEGEDGYRQCRVSDTFGPALQCSNHHGKPGFRSKFYLYCFEGFFAVECSCLSGFFYNRCLRSCDTDNNFLACPFSY